MGDREKAQVMLDHEAGKITESKARREMHEDKWHEVANPTWNWFLYEYRTKPEPKYRPYNMEIAHLLIGKTIWRTIDMGRQKQVVLITHINQNNTAPILFATGGGSSTWTLDRLFNEWKVYDTTTNTFTDIPVGILEDT